MSNADKIGMKMLSGNVPMKIEDRDNNYTPLTLVSKKDLREYELLAPWYYRDTTPAGLRSYIVVFKNDVLVGTARDVEDSICGSNIAEEVKACILIPPASTPTGVVLF